MADITIGASALLASDLIIYITPRARTEYQGTAEQLRAEGLIPDGFKWPTGRSYASYEVGNFSYTLGRMRPDGHKGPMSSWVGMDYWFLCRGLTSQERDGWRAAEIYEKAMDLAEVIRRGTPEWWRIADASRKARRDDKYQSFRSLVVPEPKRGRSAKNTTTQQPHGAST